MSRSTLLLAVLSVALRAQAQDPPSPTVAQSLDSLSLEDLMQLKVQGAALHSQTLQDAPASVTIVTAEEIRKYGYRTLGEALASVRGFYVSNDRSYQTMGVRGFSLPGDYDSHLMVMVNGHNMSDNVFDYMLYLGNDFPIDMNLIKQIEVIRGPSSSLYGNSAIFATINVITKSPEETGPLSVTVDAGSFGEKKVQVMETASLGSTTLLFSGSILNNAGQHSIFFPELATPQNNFGNAIDMNTERGYHFFSTLAWNNWTVTAAFSGHNMIQPISWGPAIFNNRGTEDSDNRNFIDAVYAREIAHGTLQWRTYYDSFRYQGRAAYRLNDGGIEDNRTNLRGNWGGTQLTYRFRPYVLGEVTLGVEAKLDLRNLQQNFDVSPIPIQYLSTSHPNRFLGFIFQDEKKLSQRWKLDLGVRLDKAEYGRDFVSPRAALIYQPSEWVVKFLYGRGFRNPSPFQLFYSDGYAALGNPSARSEAADTIELDIERKLGKRMNVQASAYGYRLQNFLLGVALPNGLIQYQNSGTIQAEGLELEINGRPTEWLEATASYSAQRSLSGSSTLSNSPNHLAKLSFAVPLGRKFEISTGMQYASSRLTVGENTLGPVYLTDLTLTSKHMTRDLDVRFGICNAFNLKYSDPVALYPIVDSMPQPGRTYFVELIAHRPR